MGTAYLRGMALNCALGADRNACVTALRAGRKNITGVHLDTFSDPLELSYYRMADAAALFDPERMERLLPPVVAAAVSQAGLNAQQCQELPVFAGSSCLSIAGEEARYARALAGDVGHALPIRQSRFDTIVSIVQETAGSRAATYTWNTACTSAANALLAAQRSLASGHYRQALVIGIELANLTTLGGFSALQILADVVRPFDARRAGMVLGEGIGVVVLSVEPGPAGTPRLLGGASNCDSYGVTGVNPDGRSIAAVLARGLQMAGVGAEQIRALKAHGTGTVANDAAEAHGMHRVFTPLPPVCALKPWLGHTMGACAVNELILFASALEHGFIPATTGFEKTDDALHVTPLIVAAPAEPGCYLLSQFGFGGNNTVLILEQP